MKTVLSENPKLAGKWLQMFNRCNRNPELRSVA